MQTRSSQTLQRLDAYFVAQNSRRRLRRLLLVVALIAGGLFWIPQLCPESSVDEAAIQVSDPFAGVPLSRNSTNFAPDRPRK